MTVAAAAPVVVEGDFFVADAGEVEGDFFVADALRGAGDEETLRGFAAGDARRRVGGIFK